MVFRGGRRPAWRAWRNALLLLGLLYLLEQEHFGGPVIRLDTAVRGWVPGERLPVVGWIAEVIVTLANPPFVVALMLVVVAAAAARRTSARPLVLGVTAAVLLVVTVLTLKYAVGRPGPTGLGEGVAWPSGHTTTAVLVCGIFAHLIGVGWHRIRMLLMVVPVVVGVALVLRNYHWLSDVLAGWLLGPLLLIAASAVAERLLAGRRAADRRKPRQQAAAQRAAGGRTADADPAPVPTVRG